MKAGIGSYSFRYAIGSPLLPQEQKMTLAQLLGFCHKNHIEVVQVCDNLPLHLLPDRDLQDGLTLAQNIGIEVELGTVGYSFSHLTNYVAIAKQFGSGVVRTVLNAKTGVLEDIKQNLRLLVPELEKSGVVLAIENHFDLTPAELVSLVKEIGHPLVKICSDPQNSVSLLWGFNETIHALKYYVASAHIKDVTVVRKGSGFLVAGSKLGEGISDLRFYLKEVFEANPACNVFLEQWMDPSDILEETLEEEMEWVKSGMTWLKNEITQLKKS